MPSSITTHSPPNRLKRDLPLFLCGALTIAPAAQAQTTAPPLAPPATNPPSVTQTPVSSPAGAPKPVAPPFKPIKIGDDITVTIFNRTRVENFDYFQGEVGAGDTPASTSGNGKYTYIGNLLRVGLTQSKPRYDLSLEIAQPSLLNLPDDATASGPGTAGQGALGLGPQYYAANGVEENEFGIFPKQGFVRLKDFQGKGNSLRLGRFEFAEGAETVPANASLAFLKRERIGQRLIGPFGFSHVGRSFDGAQFIANNPKRNITLVGARATEGVFSVRGMGELDVDFLYGAYTKPSKTSDLRVFGIYYRDGRPNSDSIKVDNRPLAARQADNDKVKIGTLGAHYLKTIPAGSGSVDLLAWGALQFGDFGNQSHSANAVALEAGYQPNSPKLKPWLRVGYFKSSGDDDPTDGDHNTFFQVLPTPRIYARFPFFNMMNNEDLFAQLILRPNPKTTVRLDAHRLSLSEGSDLYYAGGGAFQDDGFGYSGRPSGGDTRLADLFDVSVDYNLNAHTSIGAYVGFARGKDVLRNIYQSDSNGRFAFLEVTNRF